MQMKFNNKGLILKLIDMKKHFLLAFGTLLMVFATVKTASAQYGTAASVNLGGYIGVGVKHFITERSALEFDFDYNFRHHAPMVVALYQYHIPLVDNLNLYAGGGINVGARNVGKNRSTKFAFGVDPNIGFEYDFRGTPIALALDYRPAINFTTKAMWDQAALRVRFKF